MFRSIVDDIKFQFQTGNTITRLIIVNVAIFLLLVIVKAFTRGIEIDINEAGDTISLADRIMQYIFLSQDPVWDLKHPWLIFSHMFTHVGLFHMIFNMLVLYWFGRIAGDLLGDHRMLPLYLFSGLTGALFYLISAPFFYPEGSTLHGASGAIMGIVAAAGMTAPDYQMRLLLFGDVRLKYIVFGLLVIYMVSFLNMENQGGQMAHFGGAAFGFFYVHMLRQGSDLTLGFRRMVNYFRRPKRRPVQIAKRRVPIEVKQRSGTRQRDVQAPPSPSFMDYQERLDFILEKIKKSGFDSLSEDEKKFLHDASQK